MHRKFQVAIAYKLEDQSEQFSGAPNSISFFHYTEQFQKEMIHVNHNAVKQIPIFKKYLPILDNTQHDSQEIKHKDYFQVKQENKRLELDLLKTSCESSHSQHTLVGLEPMTFDAAISSQKLGYPYRNHR